MSVATAWKSLPPAAKGVIAVAGTGAILVTGYLVYTGVKSYAAKAAARKQLDAVEKDLNTLVKGGNKATLSKSQLGLISNNLFTAMDGYGTNSDAILHEFAKVNTDADMLGLIKNFGTKTISSGNLNPEPDFTGTLTACLTNELSKPYIAALNNMLARKGIINRI